MVSVELDMLALIGVSLSTVGLLVEHFHFQAKLQERIMALETKMDLFWGALEKELPPLLLKGNPIAKDSELYHLLEQFNNGTIKQHQCGRLVRLLEEEAALSDHTPGEILAMVLLRGAIRAKATEEKTC